MADLYRRRWRIEDAFNTVKRLLGLSYLWTGSLNGIQIPIWGTWIFYALLVDLGDAVADQLSLPIDSISLDLLQKSFHQLMGRAGEPVPQELFFLVGWAGEPVLIIFARGLLEMIYRGLYHFYVAHQKGKATDPPKYFAAPENQDLGIVKSQRKPNVKLIVAPFPDRQRGKNQYFFDTSSQIPLTTAIQA